jgi:hypothetical protein
MAEIIVRCSRGHLFVTNWIPLTGFRSIRLSPGLRYHRCPVERHWRLARPARAGTLTGMRLSEARRYRGGVQ